MVLFLEHHGLSIGGGPDVPAGSGVAHRHERDEPRDDPVRFVQHDVDHPGHRDRTRFQVRGGTAEPTSQDPHRGAVELDLPVPTLNVYASILATGSAP